MFVACNNSLLAERVCDVNQGFLFGNAALLCFGALVLLRTWSATSCICSVSRLKVVRFVCRFVILGIKNFVALGFYFLALHCFLEA